MDLVEILVLLAFVFFPLIQALLEKAAKRGRPPELPPPNRAEQQPLPPVIVAERRQPGPAAEESWSADWGTWPTEGMEELSSEEVLTEEQADELIGLQERLAAREVPEAVRVTVPVVSMEQRQIDRSAEHRRFHEPAPAPAARPVTRARPIAIGGALSKPSDLRRAIMLAEVLGPPRALEGMD